MTLESRIKELEKVCEAATPGPWELSEDKGGFMGIDSEALRADWVVSPCEDFERPAIHDATFISTFDPPTVARLLETVRIQAEALEFSKSGCLVPPDGGSPDVQDHINNASEALARVEKLWASGEAGE